MQEEPDYNPFHTDASVTREIIRQENDVSPNYSNTENCVGLFIFIAGIAYLIKKTLVDPQNSNEKNVHR